LGGEQNIINKLGSKQGLRCKQKGALQLACNNFKWIYNKQKVGAGKGGVWIVVKNINMSMKKKNEGESKWDENNKRYKFEVWRMNEDEHDYKRFGEQ
jgi:hypothetical protein